MSIAILKFKNKDGKSYHRVTQGEGGTLSHAGTFNMDFGGKDASTSYDFMCAPFDCKIMRVQPTAAGQMYFESLDKVEWANGTIDYVSGLLCHDSNLTQKLGQIFKQGELFYQEGTKGGVAVHFHMELYRGRWGNASNCYQKQNGSKSWYCPALENIHIYDICYVSKDTVMLNGGGYNWKIDGEKPKWVNKPFSTITALSEGDYNQFKILAEKLNVKF